jgi:sugar lactone lactonase YvrE
MAMDRIDGQFSPAAFSGRCVCSETCELGEGIAYDPFADTAWWFIKGKRLRERRTACEEKRSCATPFLGGALARVDGKQRLVVADCGLMIRNVERDAYELFRVIDDNPRTRSNDSRVHPCGALRTSRMGRNAEAGAGAIRRVDARGATPLFRDLAIPNGICFSPDGATADFADSRANLFLRVALDPATDLPIGGPSALADESASAGCIDGAICDADGLIWSARWGCGPVDAHTPAGKKIRRCEAPAPQVSRPAFAGAKANRLLATTAREDTSPSVRLRYPNSGRTFEIAASVRGRFEPNFIL